LQSGAGASACQPAEGRQPVDDSPASDPIGFVPSTAPEDRATPSPLPSSPPPRPLTPDPRPQIPGPQSPPLPSDGQLSWRE
jgi:hypothetical protein